MNIEVMTRGELEEAYTELSKKADLLNEHCAAFAKLLAGPEPGWKLYRDTVLTAYRNRVRLCSGPLVEINYAFASAALSRLSGCTDRIEALEHLTELAAEQQWTG